jgi:cell wall-associated NlpC family hydrolase
MCQKFRIQLCNIAKQWIGVKYEHCGTTRNGCDCTGLLIGIFKELGYFKDYVLRKYPKDWNLHAKADDYITEEIIKIADEIKQIKSEPGDIVTFYFGKCIAHIGIIIENGLFVHCHMGSGKCIVSRLKSSQWTKRIAGFYRIDLKRVK